MATPGRGREAGARAAARRASGEAGRPRGDAAEPRHWTFLSNHGHVLVCLARDPEARLRDVAQAVGITERAVQKIVSDLEEAGVVGRVRAGRRNRYRLFVDQPLRHALEAHRTVGSLLGMVLSSTVVRRLTDTEPPAAA